ncbi:serine esterase [Sulfurimonas sp. HSL3-7]|uniref:alpha/beta hydrolase n=1 Tax=Sulfonitrofixus jiaomeiensis TaxID=3131938 RepID=UPI0031F8F28E
MQNLPLDNIFIPSKVPSKKVMIILHGRGDSSEGFTMLPDFLQIETMNYLLLDAPFEYFTGFSWYQLPPNQLPGIRQSSQLLTETLDMLFEEEFNADESFLFGFSQGSLLTFEFGTRYHKVLAGYIAVSGYIYDASKLLSEMNEEAAASNWLCTHGTDDNVLPFETSKEQVQLLQQNGFNVAFKAYAKDHSIDREELADIAAWMRKIIEK